MGILKGLSWEREGSASHLLRLDSPKLSALSQKSKYHQGQLVDVSDPAYKTEISFLLVIPPTAVGGYFKSSLAPQNMGIRWI